MNNTISVSQLVTIAITSKVFTLLFETGYSYNFLLAIPIAVIIELLLMQIALRVKDNIIFYLYALITASATIMSLKEFLVDAIYPNSSSFFFIVTLVLAAVYASYMGLEGIVRSSFIIFILFLISLAFLILGNGRQIEKVAFSFSFSEVLKNSFKIVASSPEILLFSMLRNNVKSNIKKGSYAYILGSNLILAVATVITVLVLSRAVNYENYPYYAVSTLAKISVFERLDAIHMAIWVLIGFIRASIFTNLVKRKLKLYIVAPLLIMAVFLKEYYLLISGIMLFVILPLSLLRREISEKS